MTYADIMRSIHEALRGCDEAGARAAKGGEMSDEADRYQAVSRAAEMARAALRGAVADAERSCAFVDASRREAALLASVAPEDAAVIARVMTRYGAAYAATPEVCADAVGQTLSESLRAARRVVDEIERLSSQHGIRVSDAEMAHALRLADQLRDAISKARGA